MQSPPTKAGSRRHFERHFFPSWSQHVVLLLLDQTLLRTATTLDAIESSFLKRCTWVAPRSTAETILPCHCVHPTLNFTPEGCVPCTVCSGHVSLQEPFGRAENTVPCATVGVNKTHCPGNRGVLHIQSENNKFDPPPEIRAHKSTKSSV